MALIDLVNHNLTVVFHPSGGSRFHCWKYWPGLKIGGIPDFDAYEVSFADDCGCLPSHAHRVEEGDFDHQTPTPCATDHASREHVQSHGKTSHPCATGESETV